MANSRPDQYWCDKVKPYILKGNCQLSKFCVQSPGTSRFKTERIRPGAENLDRGSRQLLSVDIPKQDKKTSLAIEALAAADMAPLSLYLLGMTVHRSIGLLARPAIRFFHHHVMSAWRYHNVDIPRPHLPALRIV